MLADDAKLSKMLRIKYDKLLLQKALNEIANLYNIWLLSLNVTKCEVYSMRRNDESMNEYSIHNK